MEHYIVSARKYRPQTFKSVVGQDALTATLKNAIAGNHLAHAYLFCGPRGVGKTTCARIFAKTINCLNPTENGEACNECESCRAFNEQRSFNIHELDAASNNTVDDIRNLIEQVQIPPQVGRYSVYIIDEVHMLSTAAFNAFLKTLEEPPHYAIFILATTEKHKIIPTILSRCQIYDFNRIRVSDTVNHLKYVAESEGITAEDAALNVIAQKADGGMRDALSIFDQVVSFCGTNITYRDAIENLNVLDYDYYFQLVDLLLDGKIPESLLIFDSILSKGFEGQHFVGGFASHLRDIMISKNEETIRLLEVGDMVAPRYKQQADKVPTNWIYQALDIANECDLQYRTSRNKRLLVELMLIRIAGINSNLLPKKAKPELPFITAVAPSPVLNSNSATATPSALQQPQMPQQRVSAPGKTVSIVRIDEPLPERPSVPQKEADQQAQPVAEQKQPETPETAGASVANSSFSQAMLVEAWMSYARNLEKEAHTTNTMLNFPPVKTADNRVEVRVANSMQIEALSKHKNNIEKYLSAQLAANIAISVLEDVSIVKDQVFTPEERFRKMLENNDEFRKMKNALGLEIV